MEGSPSDQQDTLPCWPEGFPSGQQGTCTLSIGRKPFQSKRWLYLVDWKGFLPINVVHVPNPSNQWGTCTSLTGRKPFQSMRYMCLIN
jgi:hypothetical protein